MPAPKLSIILPNYNHAEFLPRCLDSSLSQSFSDFELIAIDDCSTDDSYAILQEYAHRDSRIRLYRNDRNRGVVATLNRALGLARGEYVHGAASDDYILPGYYEAAMGMLAQHPQAAICLGLTRCEYDNSPQAMIVPGDWADTRTYLAPDQLAERIAGCGIPAPAIWRREAFLAVGGYNPELHWHCDWFALQVIAFRYGICFLPEVFTVVRVAENSFSNVGERATGVQKTVLQTLLKQLQRPEYRDVISKFERSGVFRQFEFDLVEAAITFDGSLNHLMGILKPHVLPHATNLLRSQTAAIREGTARFLGACGADAWPFDEALAASTRDCYSKVATAAREARAAIRRSTPVAARWKRMFRQTVGRALRRFDRLFRPRIHDHLERQDQVLSALMHQQKELRRELLGQLRAVREELETWKRERVEEAQSTGWAA